MDKISSKNLKTIAQIKKCQKFDPPKSGVSKVNLVVGVKKQCFGTPKTKKKVEKIDFLKKPKLLDLPERGFGLPGWSTTKCSIPLLWYNSNKNKFAGVTCEK